MVRLQIAQVRSAIASFGKLSATPAGAPGVGTSHREQTRAGSRNRCSIQGLWT